AEAIADCGTELRDEIRRSDGVSRRAGWRALSADPSQKERRGGRLGDQVQTRPQQAPLLLRRAHIHTSGVRCELRNKRSRPIELSEYQQSRRRAKGEDYPGQ